MTERQAVALTTYGEARGEAVEGRIAVACVLRNRYVTGRWGHTFAAVASAPKQFSCWNEGDPNAMLLRRLLATGDDGTGSEPILRECFWIADGVLQGALQPRVGSATHYFATSMKMPPAWAVGQTPICRVGSHLFFRVP